MQRSRAHISLILSLVLTLSLVAPAFAAPSASDHRKAAEDARKAAEAAQAEADRLQGEVAKLDEQIDELQSKVAALAPDIAEAEKRADRLAAEVESLRAQITQKETEIRLTEADYAVQLDLLNGRLTETYKNGSWFYLELLLDSKDFDDLVARTTLVQRVIRSNQDVAQHLEDTRNALEARRVELDRNLESVQTKRAEAEAVEKKLKTMRSERQAAVSAQESVQSQKSAMMEQSEADAEKYRQLAEEEAAEAARIEAELRKGSSSGGGAYNGVMAWPVPGFYRITSPYGYRTHPIFGTTRLHTGIDVGRNVDPEQSIDGAALVAAGAGEVVYAGYRSGYGNTVMIDHGDGLVTLYAHQQSGGITVSVGQWVEKGQRIGTVGSTGYSTGPHLHFETRVNGTPVDPMGYVS